jgi:hypothetical protein
LRHPNTTASAMPCYDTRLRLPARHRLWSSDYDAPLRCLYDIPAAIPVYDFLDGPNHPEPFRDLILRTLLRHLSRCPLRQPEQQPNTNALCPCTLTLLLLSGQVRRIMQVLSATLFFHATMRRPCAHCWFDPRAHAELVSPWSGGLVYLLLRLRCTKNFPFPVCRFAERFASRYPFTFMIPPGLYHPHPYNFGHKKR